jgi:hypothetical protein
MSIYCSIFGFGEDHLPRCARIKKIRKGCYERDDSKRCTCGSCPVRYRGSHVLPSNSDERGGGFGIAAIPDHITRNGRDDRPEKGKWRPWLRVHLHGGYQESVILTKKQAGELRDALSQWLESSE